MESNNEKEYYSCNYLQSGLNFHTLNISSCNSWSKGLVFYKLNEPNGALKIDFEEIDKIRENVLSSKIIPENCKECYNLEKKDWANNNNKIKYIDIDHWRNCNCGCIYCSNRNHDFTEFLTNKVTKSPFYDVLPILEKIKEKNRLDKDLHVQLIGGEAYSLEEYEDIIKFFLNHEDEMKGTCSISMLTSAIKYVPIIGKALERPQKFLTTSLDCGSRELYKKIKQIDAFDDCVANLKKYIEHAYVKSQVILKYIFLPNINDNKAEIDKFFETVQKIGCVYVNFSLEFCQSLTHKQGSKIPENLYELFDYAESKAKEIGCTYEVWPFVKDLLKKGHY